MTGDYLLRIGSLIRDARRHKGMTQSDLAGALETSQGAIARIEQGKQNLSLETIAKISECLDAGLVTVSPGGAQHLCIEGGTQLSGSIDVKTSKNAAVALLCASLLNKGTTTLRNLARIEEVNRIIEVLNSIGVKTTWLDDSNDLQVTPPATVDLSAMDQDAARRTRTIIMFLGPLLHEFDSFQLPFAGGCSLGSRTIEPHVSALSHFGLTVKATDGMYIAEVETTVPDGPFVLTERGDTVTENALMAAARCPEVTVIRNASPNYMVQDLCFFLQELGVEIDGIGTTTLTVRGLKDIDADVEYSPSEDPIESMSLLSAAVVTESSITIRRVPIEFMEIELSVLSEMGMKYELSEEYTSANGKTRLVDLTTIPGPLKAPTDKIHPMPFPGLNIDNLPFFALIAACAEGQTMIHDWVYENRAIYLTELTKVGARVQLLDPHRVMIEGPTNWKAAEVVCPPALRPGVVVLIAMLAAKGTSVLRNVYVINRGYESLAERLNALGGSVETFRDI